jgi:membrane fusion protein, copper/silver efflux system
MTMTDRPEPQSSPTPAETARQDWQAAGSRRSPWPYMLVSALSLAVGIGATFLLLRQTNVEGEPSGAHLAYQDAAEPESDPPSEKAVFISPARQQLIGVRTGEVSERALETTIRTVGVLGYDETRIAEIHTKIAGWLESVAVDFVGKDVRRGQPLFSVYSPDLVATQKEYLLALKAQEQLGTSRFAETRDGASSLLSATRERLRLWDITDAQIAELEKTREPRRTLTVYSPFDGVVLERKAYLGQYIGPEMSVFRIADLSTIWVQAQIFEYELPLVRLGQQAAIQFPYGRSGQPLTGRIAFVQPEVDAMTRRVSVRIELKNPSLAFTPGSYVTVAIRTGSGRRLSVPKEAVIDTGTTRYVILALPDGYFEPREIQVGEPMDDFYPVLAGLQAGDSVVTSAQFLIDSETNLQASMHAMSEPPGTGGTDAPPVTGETPVPAAPPPPSARLAITFTSQPSPLRVGENALEVTVKDNEGEPVTDAQVTVLFFMPAMPSMAMPAMRSSATLTHTGGGAYRGSGQVVMAGTWQVTITASRGGQSLGTRRITVVAQ